MKRRMGKLFISGLAVLLVAIVLVGSFAGCAEPTTEVSEWNIPVITVLTGPIAFAGIDSMWAAELAVEQINDAGGIRGIPVALTFYDTAFDTAKAVQAMSEAIVGSLSIIGPMDEPGAQASGNIAADEGVPFMASLSTTEQRQMFAPWAISIYSDSAPAFGIGAEAWINQNPDIKSVVIFYHANVIGFEGYTVVAEEVFQSLGVEVLEKVDVPTGQIDLGPAAVKAMGQEPDGYYSTCQAEEEARLVVELRTRGVTEGRRICSAPGANSSTLYDVAEGSLEDTYIFDISNTNSEGARWQTLVEAYKTDHDGAIPMIMTVPAYYDAVYVIKAAIEELGLTGDPDKLAEERIAIRDFMYNLKDFEGVQGKINWVDGQKVGPVYLFQIVDNSPVLVSIVEPGD